MANNSSEEWRKTRRSSLNYFSLTEWRIQIFKVSLSEGNTSSEYSPSVLLSICVCSRNPPSCHYSLLYSNWTQDQLKVPLLIVIIFIYKHNYTYTKHELIRSHWRNNSVSKFHSQWGAPITSFLIHLKLKPSCDLCFKKLVSFIFNYLHSCWFERLPKDEGPSIGSLRVEKYNTNMADAQ